MAKARAKGQPRTAPTVKSTTAESVRWLSSWLDGINACDSANIVVYMAKEEGRRAKSVSDSRSDNDINYRWFTSGRVPHASVGGQHEKHVAGYAIVDFEADCIVQLGFTDGTYSRKNSAHEEESWSLQGV
jgi:hypothetical protein